MKRIKYIILTLGIVAGFGLVAMPATASATTLNVFDCSGTAADTDICKSAPDSNAFATFIKTIVDTMLYVLGAVSVVTIIIAGIRYTTSHGDPKAVEVAKNTLLYAVIGLIVAVMAYAIVNFVADTFQPKPKADKKAAVVLVVKPRA